MTETEKLMQAGFLVADPLDVNRSIFRIDISVLNAVVEMGAIPIVAKSVGWTGDGEPAAFVTNWVKAIAVNGLVGEISEIAGNAAKDAKREELLALI